MRIISYNILDGGGSRWQQLAQVVAQQRPDVVALVEAEDENVVRQIAEQLEMDFIVAAGAKHASALLSRFAIVQTVNHALLQQGLSRSLLEATVQLSGGGEMTLGVLHLPAHATESDEDARLAELQIILKLFEQHRHGNRPHLLCGDFNSNAPYQQIDISRCKQRTQRDWQANGGHLPRRAIQALLAAGYTDTYHLLHDEQRELIGSFDTHHPGQRVDYIFSFGINPSAVQAAWVHRAAHAAEASDHFPVGVELQVS